MAPKKKVGGARAPSKTRRPPRRATKPATKKIVKPIPDGFHTVTPYLVFSGVARVIDFLKAGLGAKEIHRSSRPDGTVMHAQVKIGDSFVMMGEPMGDMSPAPASLYLYVKDTDALYRRAIAAGGVSLREPTNEFYGDRSAGVKDPAGNSWWIATHIEDISTAELERRASEVMKQRR